MDADLGQSDIGPPTTVGLGRVRLPVERLGDAEVVGLYFVGSTSPRVICCPPCWGPGSWPSGPSASASTG